MGFFLVFLFWSGLRVLSGFRFFRRGCIIIIIGLDIKRGGVLHPPGGWGVVLYSELSPLRYLLRLTVLSGVIPPGGKRSRGLRPSGRL